MPIEVQTGRGVVFGIANSGSPVTIAGAVTFILDTVKGAHEFDIHDIKDENNFDVTAIATNEFVELDAVWTPAAPPGGSITDAYDALAQDTNTGIFLNPLARVDTANFRIPFLNGKWQYRGKATLDLSHLAGKQSLKLRKYADATQNDSLTTVVTA